MILPRTFYQRDTAEVARDLLGKILVYKTSQGRITGKIVETEAYYGHYDPASHAYRKTPRSSIMFGPPGFAYVYFNYGVHYLLNVVTAKINTPGAVLIRAVEPLEGIELMKKNRGNLPPEKLCNGPGKLTKAFGIDVSFNGHDLTKYPLVIQNGKKGAPIIKNTTRVGISVAKDELQPARVTEFRPTRVDSGIQRRGKAYRHPGIWASRNQEQGTRNLKEVL